MIFWQSPRTSKQARPAVTLPNRRASGHVLEIVVDTRETYAYDFNHQQATTVGARSPPVTTPSRSTARSSRPWSARPRGPGQQPAVRQAHLRPRRLERAAPGGRRGRGSLQQAVQARARPHPRVAEALAEAQARFPAVPIVFCETRTLAQEWTYRSSARARGARGQRGVVRRARGAVRCITTPGDALTGDGGDEAQSAPPTGIVLGPGPAPTDSPCRTGAGCPTASSRRTSSRSRGVRPSPPVPGEPSPCEAVPAAATRCLAARGVWRSRRDHGRQRHGTARCVGHREEAEDRRTRSS